MERRLKDRFLPEYRRRKHQTVTKHSFLPHLFSCERKDGAVGDEQLQDKLAAYKEDLKKKIVKANEELAKVSFKYKMN